MFEPTHTISANITRVGQYFVPVIEHWYGAVHLSRIVGSKHWSVMGAWKEATRMRAQALEDET